MIHRSKSDWLALFAEHNASGLSVVAFCRERGLNPQYFGKRRKQLQDNDNLKNPSSFVPVTMSTQIIPMLELQQGDNLVLKIPVSISPVWLAELIQQLQD